MSAFMALSVGTAAFFGDTDKVAYYVPRLWSKSACWLYLIRVDVYGRENLDPKQSYVFLANHQGYWDAFLVFGYLGRPFKWMMKEYLRKVPFLGYACYKAKHIYVGNSMASISRAVHQAEETLKGGTSMTIFPEGTRTHDGTLGEFKRGAFMLAHQIQLPIVPITINGSFDVLSRNDLWIHPGRMSMTIHAPITPEQRKDMKEQELMLQVWDTIDSSLTKKNS